MILIATLDPYIDKTIYLNRNIIGSIIRAKKSKSYCWSKGNNVVRVLNKLGIKNFFGLLDLLFLYIRYNFSLLIQSCFSIDLIQIRNFKSYKFI